MTTAQAIIEAGYSRATTNDPGKLAADGELLGRCNRFYQSLYAMAARQRPDEFTSSATITLGGAPPSSLLSAATPALADVIEIRAIRAVSGSLATSTKIHICPEPLITLSWQIAPLVYRRGLSIISRAGAGDPIAADVLQLIVLDAPVTLSALATSIDTRFPARHHEVLVNDIALYLDAKDGKRDASQFARLQADQRLKLLAFAAEYNLDASAIETAMTSRVPAAPAVAG